MNGEYNGRKTLTVELTGRRKKGRAERFMDLVSVDVKLVGVGEDVAEEEGQTIGGLLNIETKRDKGL